VEKKTPNTSENVESIAGVLAAENTCQCSKSRDEPNVLVKLGLISEELEFVLKEPPKLKLPASKRKSLCKTARVITDENGQFLRVKKGDQQKNTKIKNLSQLKLILK